MKRGRSPDIEWAKVPRDKKERKASRSESPLQGVLINQKHYINIDRIGRMEDKVAARKGSFGKKVDAMAKLFSRSPPKFNDQNLIK